MHRVNTRTKYEKEQRHEMDKSERYNESMKVWLFDLVHNNLNNTEIVQGFIKYYVMYDRTISDVHSDIHFYTNYSVNNTRIALNNLRNVLEEYAAETTRLIKAT